MSKSNLPVKAVEEKHMRVSHSILLVGSLISSVVPGEGKISHGNRIRIGALAMTVLLRPGCITSIPPVFTVDSRKLVEWLNVDTDGWPQLDPTSLAIADHTAQTPILLQVIPSHAIKH